MTDLYPPIHPYDQGMLDVGDRNLLYWEQCGKPDGTPAVMLHGGPGQGCNERMRRQFDPARYRAVLFDQRGCGRSVPNAGDPATELHANTTWHLVADIERLRSFLNIDRWLVVGGSWGSTLALTYAEAHPERVTGIVLSAITTSRRSETDWLYRGLRRFFPGEWESFRSGAGDVQSDEDDIFAAFVQAVEDPDEQVKLRAVRAWRVWEDAALSLEPRSVAIADDPTDVALSRDDVAFVRLCAHYAANGAWLDEGVLIRNADRLAGIPGVLIHGRLDLSCPFETAWELARAWPDAQLIAPSDSGHSGSPSKREHLLHALDLFANRCVGMGPSA